MLRSFMTLPKGCPLALAAALVATFAPPLPAQTKAEPKQIEVVGTDYAFLPLPAHISAGPTLFAFDNRGKVQHEMSISRLRPGVTPEEAIKAIRDGAKRGDFVERAVGILIVGPGKKPDGRLLVDLMPGISYVVLCTLKDTPESPRHLMLGMYTGFRAE
jgi:hypothetical protein